MSLVWMFDATTSQCTIGDAVKDCGYHDPDEVAVLTPSSHSQRVVAQAGVHTIHSLKGTAADSRRVLPMDETDNANQLTKIVIDGESAKTIKNELREWGVHATVYGDLTSVCRDLQDDLDIPFSMRSDALFHSRRQHEATIHTLAELISNGVEVKLGSSFVRLGELKTGRVKKSKGGDASVAFGGVVTEKLLNEINLPLKATYGESHSFKQLLELARGPKRPGKG
jgi:hypothetical protein